ncbi:MarR family winged helix-turn-helix transcriptional regulator [Tenggerimyces flavus]|uniref:MarR family winged helix-turn-helix transcriptional regulator n=1 Tax=Tenggerimyces flavus TaxID=1708749 RepID=A0ABV7YDP8_9ACTN|nr:MarR family transcriptional regulator [Tenggerimyces flavus]MBM7789040.1 DNA-binding MarR family transcriptional regulator [Tenggerimyces flavus]
MERVLIEGLMRALQDVAIIRKDLVRFAAATCPMSALALLSVLERTGGIRVGALADLLHVDISVTSRQLAQLEASGFVARKADPEDRRAHLVDLTPSGQLELESVKASVADRFSHALDGWSETDVSELTERLRRLRSDLDPVVAREPVAAAVR